MLMKAAYATPFWQRLAQERPDAMFFSQSPTVYHMKEDGWVKVESSDVSDLLYKYGEASL